MRRPWLLRSLAAPGTYKTARAGEGHQRTQLFGERRPNSANVAQRLDNAERPDGITVRGDPLRERRADAWQGLYFCRRGSVEIYRGVRRAAVRGRRCGLRFVPLLAN
jgi:hypothetical protein